MRIEVTARDWMGRARGWGRALLAVTLGVTLMGAVAFDPTAVYPVGAKVQLVLPHGPVCNYVATRAAMEMGLTNQNLSPAYFSNTKSAWDFWRSDDPACNLSHPVSQYVLVPAANGPWVVADNPTMPYQIAWETPAHPVLVPIDPVWVGRALGILCLGGSSNTGGMPDNTCEGLTRFEPSDHRFQPACNGYYPSHYLQDGDLPAYIMQVIGSFVDANGTVLGYPFLIRSSERRHVIPRDARFLQLGTNDCLFGPGNGGGANYGALVVGFRVHPGSFSEDPVNAH